MQQERLDCKLSDTTKIPLSQQQERVLHAIAEDSVLRDGESAEYLFLQSIDGSSTITYREFSAVATAGDMIALANAGLIDVIDYHRGIPELFVVSPRGADHSNQLRGAEERIVEETIQYLDKEFATRHSEAYRCWKLAEKSLRSAGMPAEIATVGHHCREAMRALSNSLNLIYRPPGNHEQSTPMRRIRAILAHQEDQFGSKEGEWVKALADYWYTVLQLDHDLAHASSRETGTPALTIEDARRAVFQTLATMTELDMCLRRTQARRRHFLVRYLGPSDKLSAGEGKPFVTKGGVIELQENQIKDMLRRGHRVEGYP